MNPIRRAWQGGQPSIGTWQGWVNPLEAERLGQLGYDWVLLDLENSGLSWDAALGLIQAIELGGSRAMIRVPSNEPADIMRALDYGAIGVVVPLVSTPEEAARAANSMRYPPIGRRANGQMRRPYESHSVANADVVCVVMIETAEGLDNLEAIAACPGIDAIMIGQVDLALSLGWPLDNGGIDIARDTRARSTLKRVVDVCQRQGKVAAAAIVGASDEDVRGLLTMGIRWIGYKDFDRQAEARQRNYIASWKRDFTDIKE